MVQMGHELLQSQNVSVLGSGEEVVVLSHGFGGDQSSWQHVLPSLTSMYTVVLFDLPFAGTNPDNFSHSLFESFYAFADNLLSILDGLQIRKCKFVGHSMSGMIGCIASIKRPELFDRVVLLCASPRYLNDKDYYGGFEQEDIDQIFTSIKTDFKAWVAGFVPLAVGVDSKDAIEQFSKSFLKIRPDIAFVVSKAIFESDFRSILSHVKVPCYFLQTTKDLAVPLVVSDYISRHVGGKAVVEILQTEGHLPHLTAPNVLIPALRNALCNMN